MENVSPPSGLEANPLVIAFGVGPGRLSEAQLQSITGMEAFNLGGRDHAAMGWAVGKLVARVSAGQPLNAAAQERLEPALRSVIGTYFSSPLLPAVALALEVARDGRDLDLADGYRLEYPPMPAAVLAEYNAQRRCSDTSSICHAANTSMYFAQDGGVSACCLTKAARFGMWPERSISEIWAGSAIKALRDALAHNVLPLPCSLCADQFPARNFKNLLASTFDHAADLMPAAAVPTRHGAKRYPVCLEFELSNKCNLECAMCNGMLSSSIRENREKLPPLPQAYDQRFIEELREFVPHLKQAKFLGGEPFLIDLYFDIWELFIESNPDCVLSITTNATALSPKILRVVERLNCQIVVSLDSLVPEIYEAIRVNAKLPRVLQNVEQFVEASAKRGRSIAFAVCPMPSNVREVPELVRFANARNATIYFNTVLWPKHQSLQSLPAVELAEIAVYLRDSTVRGNTANARANTRAMEDLAQLVQSWAA